MKSKKAKQTSLKKLNAWWAKAKIIFNRLPAHLPFIVLLVAGGVLRYLSFTAYRPALLYFGDSYYYLQDAKSLQPDSFHPLGYAWFLHAASWVGGLSTVNFAQHALGLLAAIIVYCLFLKLRFKPWQGALAAAPILLDGYIINSENMVMSEALTGFLLIVFVALLLWSAQKKIWQMILAGIVLAFAVVTRSATVVFILPAALLVLFSGGFSFAQKFKSKILLAAVLLVSFIVPLLGYCYLNQADTGQFTIDNKTNLFLYGRLAPLANCSKLPAAQKPLCDSAQPVSERGGPTWFIWSHDSPMRQKLKTHNYTVPEKLLGKFNKAVLKNQLPGYLGSVITETARYFKPARTVGPADDPLKDIQFPTSAHWTSNSYLAAYSFLVKRQALELMPTVLPRPKVARFLHNYQRYIYLPGILMAVGIVLAAVAFIKKHGPKETAAAFLIISGLMFLGATSALAAFNYRYLLPTEEIIWMGGIIGLAVLLEKLNFKFLKKRKPSKPVS